jgi:hypothetical protein
MSSTIERLQAALKAIESGAVTAKRLDVPSLSVDLGPDPFRPEIERRAQVEGVPFEAALQASIDEAHAAGETDRANVLNYLKGPDSN